MISLTEHPRLIAVLSPIDAEEFYDYVLAHSPEFVTGRKAAEERFGRGEYGEPLDRIVAALRGLAEDAPNLDIKTIAGATPGWFRLRIGEYRICHYRIRHDGPDGPVTIYVVERIVPRGAFDAAAISLPEQR